MPKKGLAICARCNKEYEGIFPDKKGLDEKYSSEANEIDQDLVSKLQEHHDNSALIKLARGNIGGHRHFEVFLEDGSTGVTEVSSYYVTYCEHGKER